MLEQKSPTYPQLDKHAFTAHSTRTPQVINVLILLIQFSRACGFFVSPIIP